MNDTLLVIVAASAVFYGTPLFFAALGELFAERSGVLNLGVEGMMLMGALGGAAVSANLGGPGWFVLGASVVAGMVAGALVALIHAFATITLRVNQIISGLALTIFAGAAGLSSYLAQVWNVADAPVPHQFERLDPFGFSDTPVVGPIIVDQNLLTYLSWPMVALASWYLFRTRRGLHLRSVGESPQTADAMGINVVRHRYGHTMLGGALAGLGGVYFSLSIVPTWVDGMTAGRGWIAIALVIFGFWRPTLTLFGAYLFGAFASLGLTLQARGSTISPQLLDSLPYLMTIVVLVVASSGWAARRASGPSALGENYDREDR